jgi:hypothetical protein
MESYQDQTQPDLTVFYTCDHKTGRINLTIEYNSSSDTWPEDHERQHFDLVQRILDDSGILGPDAGSIYARIRRANMEYIYEVTREGEKLTWRLESERYLTAQAAPPPPSSQPLKNTQYESQSS